MMNRNAKKSMCGLLVTAILCGTVAVPLTGCSKKETTTTTTVEETTEAPTQPSSETEESKEKAEPDMYVGQYSAFDVTSDSLHDGFWDDATSDTGSNKSLSPHLSWQPVDGASCYVIYMVDLNANCFVHWKQGDITETTLPEGSAPRKNYIGPYPPAGSTHQYNIYVIALKNPVEKLNGSLRSICPDFSDVIKALDTDKDGNTGNILAAGTISGKFKS